MKAKLFLFFVLLAVVAIGIIYASGSINWEGDNQAAVHLSASIEMLQEEHTADDPILLRFSLTNETAEPLNVLTWNTPLEGIHSDMFNIEKDGQPVAYINKYMKRGDTEAHHFVTIAPGQTISTVINLEYSHDLHEAGQYTVSLDTAVLHYGTGTPEELAQQEQFTPHPLQTEAIQFKAIDGRTITRYDVNKTNTIQNCTSDELWVANEAMDIGLSMVLQAELVLRDVDAREEPFKEWFGTTSTANIHDVLTKYAKIRTGMLQYNIEIFCDRSITSFAYVFPSEHKIYLGQKFWDANMTGIDSKAGTMIHEVSHFHDVGDTDDIELPSGTPAYGTSNAKDLAETSPAEAMKNADNYEYFAESMLIYSRWRIISGNGDWTTINRSSYVLSSLRIDNGYSYEFGKLCKDYDGNGQPEVRLPIDFNGDGRQDVFAVNSANQWIYSRSGSSSETTLNSAAVALESLRFGDFDGDGKTDVFTKFDDNLNVVWGGRDGWHSINSTGVPLEALRFGDFDGDGKTDVFAKFDQNMRYLSGGRGSWINLSSSSVALENLRFGDFDGDGTTDILTKFGTGVNVLYAGLDNWEVVISTSVLLEDLRFGDFDGDCKTDVLAKFNNTLKYVSGLEGSWIDLTTTGLTLDMMRFGDFDGDKKSDVFAVFSP